MSFFAEASVHWRSMLLSLVMFSVVVVCFALLTCESCFGLTRVYLYIIGAALIIITGLLVPWHDVYVLQ